MKKKNVGIVAGLIALRSKVFGMGIPTVEPLYGPPQPPILEFGLKIFQTIIAPILFLIGIIIYLKKSKASKKRKIITTIIFVLLLIGIYCGLELLLDSLMW